MDYYAELLFAERVRSLAMEQLIASMPSGLSDEQQRSHIEQEFSATVAAITEDIKEVALLIKSLK
jgi:hypothetical protein